MSESRRNINISTPVFDDEEWKAVRDPLLSGWVTQGPNVARFEKSFAERHKVKYALATTSCTTALHLILAAMDIGPGDEVIVPSFTWVATANAALYCGAKPVIVDVDPNTFNIDPASVERAITKNTKAIMAVHLFGLCADMDGLRAVAGNIPIIEDAACAAGASYKGTWAGSLGFAAAFSFHPRKSITTGEGGMVTTNDTSLSDKMTMLRNHGASISEEERHHGPQPYILPAFPFMGFNYRMTDIQGAIGNVQLSKMDAFIDEREKWAAVYRKELAGLEWLRMPPMMENCRHGWQSFVCYVDESKAPLPRNEIMKALHRMGVSTRPGTHSIHMLKFYQERFGYKDDDFPGARDSALFSMAIPLHNKMTEEDYAYVIHCLNGLS